MTRKSVDLDTDNTELPQDTGQHSAEFDGVVAYAERIAHDANNYIGAILGLSEVLPTVADDPDQVARIATRIAAAGQLLQIVVNQALLPMLDRFDAPVLHVEDAIERLRALSRHLIGRRIALQLPPSLLNSPSLNPSPSIAMTLGEFSTLIFILLRNAVDAADLAEGARPHLRVAMDDLAGDEIAADAQKQFFVSGAPPSGQALAFRVIDNGHGFSEVFRDNAASAFQPFVSQSRRTSALGLGLTFARAIVERRGGAIAIGRGGETCVTAYLPLHAHSESDAVGDRHDDVSSPVIVVDPAEQWGGVTATLLGLLDWPVQQAGSLAEAAALLATSGRERHVVVIRVPFKSLDTEAANLLQAAIISRANVDLVMVVGPIRLMTRDETAADVLAELATLVLPGDTAPADIVNYLIPNI